MMTIEDLEKQYLSRIKEQVQKLSQINSVTGFVMHESDIQRLYQDFVFLKELQKNSKNLSSLLDIVKEEKTITSEEKPVKHHLDEEQLQVEVEKPETVIDYNFSINKSDKLKPLQIDVNDNIAFLKILFKDDKLEYNKFLEDVNQRNEEASKALITHYQELLEWGKQQQEYIDRLLELNQNRFA